MSKVPSVNYPQVINALRRDGWIVIRQKGSHDFQSSIHPILDIKAGAEIMFGTSAYLWFKEKKLIQFTFQIIQNRMAAEISLKKLEEKLIEFLGKPASSKNPFIIWETESQKFTIEYPQRMHGYIHLLDKF